MQRAGRRSFAACPPTENGLIRIVRHPKYSNSPGPPSSVLRSLAAIRGLPGHTFWPDKVSVAAPSYSASGLLSSHSRVTDSYLLALAHANGGRLAAMHTKSSTEGVVDGKAALEVI